MESEKELLVKEALFAYTKEELIDLILSRLKTKQVEQIPITIFATRLSPLQSVTRYLFDRNKKVSTIARILSKRTASVSEALRNSKDLDFNISQTDLFIPISEFTEHPALSILEVVVVNLKARDYGFTDIARKMQKSPKTIWTVYKRAQKKID